MTLSINGAIARNSVVAPADVRALKQALNRLGLYIPNYEIGMNDVADEDMFEALTSFQKLTELPADGQLSPEDSTWLALSSRLEKLEENGSYIWMTVRDDRVRPSHYNRHNKIFKWSTHPWPAEEDGCRCWAVNLTEEQAAAPSPSDHRSCFQEPWLHLVTEGVKRFEDIVKFPYADGKGILTSGIGTNLNERSTFLAVPWRYGTETGRLATEVEKQEAYETLRGFVAKEIKRANVAGRSFINIAADRFKNVTSLRLPTEDAMRMMERDKAAFLNELANKFRGFGCFPGPAKAALMDMIYNIGGTKFIAAKWPLLFSAVGARDWGKAAVKSRRVDVSEERNAYTRNLFMQAAEMEKRATTLPSP